MHYLVTAECVEDLLSAVAQVDRRDVSLIVAGVADVPVMDEVEVRGAVRRSCERERRGDLFDVPLESAELRPTTRHDLGAVADAVFVDVSV
jgi:hypothetical protein